MVGVSGVLLEDCSFRFKIYWCDASVWDAAAEQRSEVGFIISESTPSDTPSPAPSAEICFPLPWVSAGPLLQVHAGTGQWEFIFH